MKERYVRTISTILILALLGTTVFMTGMYMIENDNCEGGTTLYVDMTPINDSERDIHFENLTSSEQRIFLESHTSNPSFSNVYSNEQINIFQGIDSVEYKNNVYEVELYNSTCGPNYGIFVKRIGASIALIGVVTPVIITIWRNLRSA